MAVSYKNKLIAKGASALRINKTVSYLRDLFAYAIDHKHYTTANPFDNLTIAKTGKVKQDIKHYEEFTDAELKQIFEDHRYLTYLNKPEYHWIPFLALYSGARLGELAGLKGTDIKLIDGVYCIVIEKAKNTNSIRKVPLHKKSKARSFLITSTPCQIETGNFSPI
jgi:integrase